MTCLLSFGLPDFLPGKRASAAQLLIYHAVVSAVFYQADPAWLRLALPPFVAKHVDATQILAFAPLPMILGTLHGTLALLISVWYVALLTQVAIDHPACPPGDPRGRGPGRSVGHVVPNPMDAVAQALVAVPRHEVAHAWDVLAVVVNAAAKSLAWETSKPASRTNDVYWSQSFTAADRTVEVAVVRQHSHIVVLGTSIKVRSLDSYQDNVQRTKCTSWEAVLDEAVPPKALPWHSDDTDALASWGTPLVQGIYDVLEPLAGAQSGPSSPHAGGPPPKTRGWPAESLASASHADDRERSLRIGDADRDPLAASGHRPFLGGYAPPDVFAPPRGDGMIVGPDHPMFRGPPQQPAQGPWGGDGFLPPGAVPPGARFDPVVPMPGQGPRPPMGGPRGGRGDPDWDDVRPPGAPGSMFL